MHDSVVLPDEPPRLAVVEGRSAAREVYGVGDDTAGYQVVAIDESSSCPRRTIALEAAFARVFGLRRRGPVARDNGSEDACPVRPVTRPSRMNPAPLDARTAGVDIGFAEPPEIRETHTGVVVLIGDRAYKGKKPVVTDFLDFSTVQSREIACDREVRLNSRIAADAYLGVGHLSDPSGGAAEPVVVMRRYPDAVRLASMVQRGESVDAHLVAVARTLARFHANAQRSQAIDAAARARAIRARWEENLNVLRGHAGTILASENLAEVQRRVRQFIDGRAALIADRVSDHRIVDGHGDLIANDIFCAAGRTSVAGLLGIRRPAAISRWARRRLLPGNGSGVPRPT